MKETERQPARPAAAPAPRNPERLRREAAALRANLLKRKAQGRQRKHGLTPDEPTG
jgi:hypothetical protein